MLPTADILTLVQDSLRAASPPQRHRTTQSHFFAATDGPSRGVRSNTHLKVLLAFSRQHGSVSAFIQRTVVLQCTCL